MQIALKMWGIKRKSRIIAIVTNETAIILLTCRENPHLISENNKDLITAKPKWDPAASRVKKWPIHQNLKDKININRKIKSLHTVNRRKAWGRSERRHETALEKSRTRVIYQFTEDIVLS